MADNQGHGSPKDPQGEGSEPDFATKEDLNRAITARLKDFEKKLEKQSSELSTSITSKMEEMLTALKPPAPPDPKGQVPVNPLDHPEVRGMKRQLQVLEEQALQLKAERDAEHARNRESTLRNKLREELSRSEVDAKRLQHAVGILVDAEKRVRWSGDGDSIVFVDSDGSELDLSSGVKSWVRSDEGKLFLPPRGTSGTGGRAPGGKGNIQNGVDRGSVAGRLSEIILGQGDLGSTGED